MSVLEKNQKGVGKVKNVSKRFSSARMTLPLVLLLISLSALAPNALEASSPIKNSSVYTFANENVQENQKENTYTEEELEKGTERLNQAIKYYENEFTGKYNTKKKPEEIVRHKYIANLLRGLDKNTIAQCAYNFELLDYDEDDRFNFVSLNDEFIDFDLRGVNITKDLNQGLTNLRKQLEILRSKYTENGELKSEARLYSDDITALILGEHEITKEELNFLSTYSKVNERDLTSEQLSKLIRGFSLIYSKINFLTNKVNKQCDIQNYVDKSNIKILLNGTEYLYFSENGPDNWTDKTKMMNEQLMEQNKLGILGTLDQTIDSKNNENISQSKSLKNAEMKNEVQNENAYNEEEIQRGTQRILDLINFFQNTYREDGKTKKSKNELEDSNYIIELFSNLDPESYGKYAEKLEFVKTSIRDYNIIFANGEFIDCSKDNISYLKDLEQGFRNAAEAMASLQSNTTQSGKNKTQSELDFDNLAIKLFKDYLISENDIEYIYTESKNRAESENPSNNPNGIIERIARNITFLSTVGSKKIEVDKFIDEENKIRIISINKYICLLYESNGKDITDTIYNPFEKSNKTTKQLSDAYHEYQLY